VTTAGLSPQPPAGRDAVPDSLAEILRTPFDSVLSDPVRLRLQAALHGLPPEGAMTFTALRKALQLSDGNLAAHLAILVDAGYAVASATWRGKRRTTWYATTPAGRAAFDGHVQALEAVIGAAQQPRDLPSPSSRP
jgi:DNA-binding transcriptional ArsR family regulator